jgi:spermidine/putrescine transport system ATP-binding protein
MTMADTVAVMNAGRVEQMGGPADLYENPASTFVANFLGTSNLIAAEVTGVHGEELRLVAAGQKLTLPAARCRADVAAGDRVLAGVRPEKITLAHRDDEDAIPAGRNRVQGRIVDSSFIGVSTQYVVDSPVGQELEVFVPNVERDGRLVPGAPVVLHWNPEHTFGLDAAQDIEAGTDTDDEPGAGGAAA